MAVAGVERIEDVRWELEPLLGLHHLEIGSPHGEALDPDWDAYISMNRAGRALMVTLREEGLLVGYWVGFLGAELHHRRVIAATTDIFWVHPARRGTLGVGSLALRLFRAVEATLLAHGVVMWYTDLPLGRNYKGFLEALGHRPVSTFFARRLGG